MIGMSGHVRREIPVLSDTAKQLITDDAALDAEQDTRHEEWRQWMRDGVKRRVLDACYAELWVMSWDDLLDAIEESFPDTYVSYLADYKEARE